MRKWEKAALGVFLLLVVVGAVFWSGLSLLSSRPLVYEYSLVAEGGMGALQIESKWQGLLSVRSSEEGDVLTIMSSDGVGSVLVNGASRADLVDALKRLLESRSFQVHLKDGWVSSIHWSTGGESMADSGIPLLETQLRQIAHLLFVPSPKAERSTGVCFLGECEYRFEDVRPGRYRFVRKPVTGQAGVQVQGRFEVEYDDRGLLQVHGSEDVPEDERVGIRSRTTLSLKRIDAEAKDLSWAPQANWIRVIGPSVTEVSAEQKRLSLKSRFENIDFKTIMKEGDSLAKSSDSKGEYFVRLRDYLWLHPEELSKFIEKLKGLSPESPLFSVILNAISAQESEASQASLQDLSRHFVQQPRVFGQILISLADTENPSASSQQYFTEISRWSDEQAPDESTRLARLLVGTLARSTESPVDAERLVTPSMRSIERLSQDQEAVLLNPNALIEHLEVIGNSGYGASEPFLRELTGEQWPEMVRGSAYRAMRFVAGSQVTKILFDVVRSEKNESLRSAAKTSLQLRCQFLPAECDDEQKNWIRDNP